MLGHSLLDSVVKKNKKKLTELETVHYLFFEKGITLKEFNQLPIPYIFSIVRSHNFIEKQKSDAMESSKRK